MLAKETGARFWRPAVSIEFLQLIYTYEGAPVARPGWRRDSTKPPQLLDFRAPASVVE